MEKSFETPVSTFKTLTVTPGISAPEASVTVPRMSPEFVLCAKHIPLPTAEEGVGPTAACSTWNCLQRLSLSTVSVVFQPGGETHLDVTVGIGKQSA